MAGLNSIRTEIAPTPDKINFPGCLTPTREFRLPASVTRRHGLLQVSWSETGTSRAAALAGRCFFMLGKKSFFAATEAGGASALSGRLARYRPFALIDKPGARLLDVKRNPWLVHLGEGQCPAFAAGYLAQPVSLQRRPRGGI